MYYKQVQYDKINILIESSSVKAILVIVCIPVQPCSLLCPLHGCFHWEYMKRKQCKNVKLGCIGED